MAVLAVVLSPLVAPDRAAGQTQSATQLGYTTDLIGVDDRGLTALLTDASNLFSLEERAPATLAGLQRRAEDDLDRLQTVLRSEGYYAARVDVEIDPAARPVEVALHVVPGPLYTLRDYIVDYGGAVPDATPTLADINIERGAAARAPVVVAAERNLVSVLAERGYPFVRVLDREVVVDHDTRRMTVTVRVETGPAAVFGPVTVHGLDDVAPDFVDGLIDCTAPSQARRCVPAGEPFDARRLDGLRRTLSETGLFTSVAIETPPALEDGDRLPVAVTVIERKHRSLGAGASFSTDAGPGGRVSWTHRNLFHRGERLRLALATNELEQTAEASFAKPTFLRPDQTLRADMTAGRRDTDAFEEDFVEGLIGVERVLDAFWRAGIGVSGEFSRVDASTGRTEFTIFGVPVKIGFDSTTDPLDPKAGLRADLTVTPKAGADIAGASTLTAIAATAAASAYYPIDPATNYVLAGRLRLGTIVGESLADLPADQRLFAGGANSIRGFEFQRAGPLDADGDPTGGRSFVDFGVELRARVLGDWGLVVFADGGGVSRDEHFDIDERLFVAAGAGLRYYTRLGPIRFDIAFPLNGRDGVDDLFQFYVSFGQAF